MVRAPAAFASLAPRYLRRNFFRGPCEGSVTLAERGRGPSGAVKANPPRRNSFTVLSNQYLDLLEVRTWGTSP